jgi:hypothetical protein
LKQGIPLFLRESSIPNLLTAPLIFSLVIPIAALDAWISIYQAICFRIYGIARVRRSQYVVIDRQHLAYLNAIERLNCMYCGYANGVFAYVREVAGRTEQYWCPIRHAKRVRAPDGHYRHFVDFGDAEGYRRRLTRAAESHRPAARTNRDVLVTMMKPSKGGTARTLAGLAGKTPLAIAEAANPRISSEREPWC